MTDIANRASLGDIVAARPAAARVFETFGLDYCCNGDRTLEDACTSAGVDLDTVAARLADLDDAPAPWTALGMSELAAHIVETHHEYLYEELPLLDALAKKVYSVHGQRHPELAEIADAVFALRADLEPHLAKEELILFPAIKAIEEGEREFRFGPIDNPVGVMRNDHDRAGELLAKLRELTGGYRVPDDACASYRSLFDRLEELEADTHAHIHKENHTLFPAAIAAFHAGRTAQEAHDDV